MRPRLLHPLGEQRQRRGRRGRHAAQSHPAASPRPSSDMAAQATAVARRPDPAVQRVREAGGPIDRAAYTCECGYCFKAPVSTTVHCPHCGAGQAW